MMSSQSARLVMAINEPLLGDEAVTFSIPWVLIALLRASISCASLVCLCVCACNEPTTWAKNLVHFSICACHPCAGAMLIFSVSFQFYRMIPEGNPLALLSSDTDSSRSSSHGQAVSNTRRLYVCRRRPYLSERTKSLSTSEVKRRRARVVLT